jgi:hypothetical protein
MSEPVPNDPKQLYAAVPHLDLRLELDRLIGGIREIEMHQSKAMADIIDRRAKAHEEFSTKVEALRQELLAPIEVIWADQAKAFVEPTTAVIEQIKTLMASRAEVGDLIWDDEDLDATRCCVSGLPVFSSDDPLVNGRGLAILPHVARPDYDRLSLPE